MNRKVRDLEQQRVAPGLPPLDRPPAAEPEDTTPPADKTPAPAAPKPRKNVVRVKLTEEQKQRALRIIKDEFVKINSEYDEAEHLENADKSLKEYELSHEYTDFPVDNASNKKIALLTVAADITASKVKRQVCTPKPLALIELAEYTEKSLQDIKDKLHNREEYLDGILRKDVKFEELVPIWARMACVQGVSVIKTVVCGETDWHVTGEDEDGKAIEEKVDTFYGTRCYRVKLENFFARLKIADFKKHKVIGERLENFTFADIEQRITPDKNGITQWDEDAVQKIKDKLGDKYLETNFNFYECIVFADLREKGKYRRFVVTFDDETEEIVRCIYYPYRHAQVNYTPIVAIPNDQSWAGYSYWKRLEDVIAICEKYVNYKLNSYTISHKPVAFIDDDRFDAQRMLINKNINVFKIAKGSRVTQMKMDYDFGNSSGDISFFMNLGDLITGVSAALMSGRETPNDPRAPAAKTAMKLQESNMRVEDVAMNMEVGLATIVSQVDMNYYQYVNSTADVRGVQYISGDETKPLPLDTYDIKVRYVIHGSRVAFDKGLDLQINLQTAEYTQKLFPEIWEHFEARLVFARNIYNNSEGSVEQNKATLLKPLELYAKAAAEREQAIKEGKIPPTIPGRPQSQGMPPGMPPGQPPVGPQPTIPASVPGMGPGMVPGGGR